MNNFGSTGLWNCFGWSVWQSQKCDLIFKKLKLCLDEVVFVWILLTY